MTPDQANIESNEIEERTPPPKWVEGTDWELLREQKGFLLGLARLLQAHDDEGLQLEGLIQWIDVIQDWAVENGLPEEVVFGDGKPSAGTETGDGS